MKFTKKLLTTATCAIMAVTSVVGTSMIGMSVSATDDHGDTRATATTYTSGEVTGIISDYNDVDMFKYKATTNGIRYFYVSGTGVHASEIEITIKDSSGNNLNTSDIYNNRIITGYNMVRDSTYYISVHAKTTVNNQSYKFGSGTSLTVTRLSQNDSRWKNTKLYGGTVCGATDHTYCTSCNNSDNTLHCSLDNHNHCGVCDTFDHVGCVVTSFTMMTNFMKKTSHIPTDFNNSTYLSNALFLWSAPNSLGYTVQAKITDATTAKNKLAKGIPVMLRVDSNSHCVVAKGYQNGQFIAVDPDADNNPIRYISDSAVSWYTIYTPT